MDRRDVGVILLAAGRSARMGAAESKVWLELDGEPVLARSLRTLARFERLAELALVARGEDVDRARALVADVSPGLAGRARVVAGGAERRDSARCGLEALSSPGVSIVLVHDAARPLASLGLFERVADAAARRRSAVPALPVADTLRKRDRSGRLETLARDGLHAMQTPQGFERRLLERAYAAAPASLVATDDAVLVEALGEPVELVEGEPGNLKITVPADLELAAKLLRGLEPALCARFGLGHDLHRLEPGGPLRLGGVDLESDVRAVGHSDGDVLLHALADAVLGALALGDLGQRFPDTAPEHRGRDSSELLSRALALARGRGYAPAQVDAVVRLERPRLAPHHGRIVARVAELLGLPRDRVSIKAKTGEGLDAVGEGRAVAADALVQMAVIGTRSESGRRAT
jgi:2-C-methyl-D-erythritol 4-phosphate cytidylyltransferase/2-C-methyl-D-erythritol 2,4-cyclodiphosphate synthase